MLKITRLLLTLLLLTIATSRCDSGNGEGPMTAENADLSGTYTMIPVMDSDDPYVGAGTILFEMTNVVIDHSGGSVDGTASCRWTFTPDDPLGAPLIQLGNATLTGSYDPPLMELGIQGSNCPKGAFAGTWTTQDTLVFDIGGSFDESAPLVLVLIEAAD